MLVSQVVTQRDAHLLNTREMSAAFRESYPADKRPLLIVGRAAVRRDDGARPRRRPRLHPGYDARRGRVVPRPPARTRPRAEGELTLATRNGKDVGTRVVHRRYVPYSHAHYAGNLVDGAYSLGLFGDVATEMCILTDGDEGLFASYSDVQFKEPVRAGDVLEIVCELVKVGTRSRVLDLSVSVVARGNPSDDQPGAAEMLDPPLVATTATGTVVVPE